MAVPVFNLKSYPNLVDSLDEVKTFVHNDPGITHFIDIEHIVRFVSPGEMEFYGDGADRLEGITFRHHFFSFRDRFIVEKNDIRDMLTRQHDLQTEIARTVEAILMMLPKRLRKFLAVDFPRFIANLPPVIRALWPESLDVKTVYLIKKDGMYWKSTLVGIPVFLREKGDFLGWLIPCSLISVSKQEYNKARKNGTLVIPTESTLKDRHVKIQALHKAALRYFPHRTARPSHLALVQKVPADSINTDGLTIGELKERIKTASSAGDVGRLYHVYQIVKGLFDEVQKGLRSALGILNQKAVVILRIHKPPKYTKKSGEVSEYKQVQARWTDNGEAKSKTIKP